MPSANRELLDTFPWHETPLGPQSDWPVEMRSIVQAIMATDFPVCTGWGDDVIQIYNDAYNQIFGEKHPASFGASLRDSWPEIWSFLSHALGEVVRTGDPLIFRDTMLPLAKKGVPEECYLDFCYSAITAIDGRILGLMSIATETTETVISRRRQDMSRIDAGAGAGSGTVFQGLHDVLRDNPMDCRSAVLFRLSTENGMPTDAEWSIRAEPKFIDALRPLVASALSGAQESVLSLPPHVVTDDRAAQVSVLPVSDSRGQLIAAIAIVPDRLVPVNESFLPFAAQLSQRVHTVLHATELKDEEVQRAQEGMAEQSAMYQFLFENIRDGAIYTATGGRPDDDEVVLALNRRACEMLGYSAHEAIGMSRASFFFDHDTALASALRKRSESGFFVGDLTFRSKDGQPVPVEVTSNIVELHQGETRSVTIIRDISARQARERERENQMRTEVIAGLTRAVAHDFNNLLTVILGSLDVLEDTLTGEENRALLTSALRAAEEAGNLTSQLLTFSGRQATTPRRLDVYAHLQEIRPLLASAIGDTCALEYDFGDQIAQCWIEPSILTSGLINLATNARHSMRNGGTLSVAAQIMSCDALPEAHDGHVLALPQYLVLRVRDTGAGIADDIRSRVFEPFFSTKGLGDGTGLGLPTALNAMRLSGGDLRLAPASNSGAEFLIILPIADPAEGNPPEQNDTKCAEGIVVLYVEDNAMVREQTIHMLEQLGFLPLVARHGREAVDLARTDAHIDIVLTDLVMPGGLSGRAVVRELKHLRPGVPVVITTGYDPDDYADGGGDEFVLRKPYSRDQLGKALLQNL